MVNIGKMHILINSLYLRNIYDAKKQLFCTMPLMMLSENKSEIKYTPHN